MNDAGLSMAVPAVGRRDARPTHHEVGLVEVLAERVSGVRRAPPGVRRIPGVRGVDDMVGGDVLDGAVLFGRVVCGVEHGSLDARVAAQARQVGEEPASPDEDACRHERAPHPTMIVQTQSAND